MADDVNKRSYDQVLSNYYSDTEGLDSSLSGLKQNIDTVDERMAYAEKRNAQAEARAKRNSSRYNIGLTAAERQEQGKMLQRQGQANIANAGTQAIRSDEFRNLSNLFSLERLQSSLYDSASQNNLALGQMSADRYSAYQGMRGAADSSRSGFLGGLAKTAGSILGSMI